MQLRCDRQTEDVCKDLQEGQDGHDIAPGAGTAVMSFDTDTFEAFLSDGETVASFRVDVSRGIVQDWVIGFQPKHSDVHKIDPPAGGGKAGHLAVQGRSSSCSKQCRSDRTTNVSQPLPLEDWDVTAMTQWLVAELDLPAVALAATQHAVDGSTGAAMLREDWIEIGASGFESAKVTTALKKLLPHIHSMHQSSAPASASEVEIVSENDEEIQLTIGGEAFLVDKDSGLAFR